MPSFLLPKDIGAGKGKYYAVNYPLRDGIDDESYEAIFKPVNVLVLLVHFAGAAVASLNFVGLQIVEKGVTSSNGDQRIFDVLSNLEEQGEGWENPSFQG